MFDLVLFALAIATALGLVAPNVLMTSGERGADQLLGTASVFLWVLVEAFLISRYGMTPGKWIFRVGVALPHEHAAVDPEMAKYFGVNQGSGVLITRLTDKRGKDSEASPAAKAGMKPEDVIVAFNATKINSVQDLRLAVDYTPPGKQVKAKVVRFRKELEFDVTVALMPRSLSNEDTETGNHIFEEKPEETNLKSVSASTTSQAASPMNSASAAARW